MTYNVTRSARPTDSPKYQELKDILKQVWDEPAYHKTQLVVDGETFRFIAELASKNPKRVNRADHFLRAMRDARRKLKRQRTPIELATRLIDCAEALLNEFPQLRSPRG